MLNQPLCIMINPSVGIKKHGSIIPKIHFTVDTKRDRHHERGSMCPSQQTMSCAVPACGRENV